MPIVLGIGGNLSGLIGFVLAPVGLIVGMITASIYLWIDDTPKDKAKRKHEHEQAKASNKTPVNDT